MDKENHGFVLSDKNTTFDLMCKSETGERFIVEMQFAGHKTFKERMLVYSTYPIRAQMDKRMMDDDGNSRRRRMDYSLHPVYVISLINFKLDHESDKALEDGLVSRYDIRNPGNGELFSDALHFIFMELGRLKVKEGDWESCSTPLERLAYSLRYMHLLDGRPEGFCEDIQLMLYNASELANMTQKQRYNYDKAMTTKLDILIQKREAREEGLAEGREEGRAEGAIAEKQRIAEALKALGVSEDIIAKAIKAGS